MWRAVDPGRPPLSPAAAILAGGLTIGTIDIAYAIVFWSLRNGVRPSRIFQSVAAGLLGPAAFKGGLGTAFVGAGLHYFIATMIVLVCVVASRWVPLLTARPVLSGAIYGIGVYAVMNYVVIPLSATKRGPFLLSWVVCSVIVHAFLIGVPAALFARAARG